MRTNFNVVATLIAVSWAVMAQAALPGLQVLAPSDWNGATRVSITPNVVGVGVSNASAAAGYAYQLPGSNVLIAGALLLRTADHLPYEHNAKTCRLVDDGAIFTAWTTISANQALFPAYQTTASNGNEWSTQFVAWTLSNGSIIIDSRNLAEDYAPVQGAVVDSVTVQVWAVNLPNLNSLLRASLALWAKQGKVTFRNTSSPPMPQVMIQQASHFGNSLSLQVMNYSDQPQQVAITVERFLTTDQTATPVVTTQTMSVAPSGSNVQVPVNPFIGAMIYVQDQTGAKDQAFLGRALQPFTDAAAGGTSAVSFVNTGCASAGTNSSGTLPLLPECATLTGMVQQYSGIYVQVGSYIGEVVSLENKGVTGIEFYGKFPVPVRVQVEDIHVLDGDFHGVNLPATSQWTKFQIDFKDLSQRGFGKPVAFTGQVLHLSWVVPTVVRPASAKATAFSLAVDAIAFRAVNSPAPAAALQSISVTPSKTTIPTGSTQQFTATGKYTDNSTENLTASVTWNSSTPATATIKPGGLATGAGAGTATISASLGSVSGSTTLTITPPTVSNPAIHAVITGGQVSGTVSGVTPPQAFRVVVWAQTNAFYIQPCTTTPLTLVASAGTWGPIGSHNGTIFVQLVSASYAPPSTTSALPPVDGVKVFAVAGPVGIVNGSNIVPCSSQ